MKIVQRLLGRIKRTIYSLYEWLLFSFCCKKENCVFFYPHPNGRVDGYDVINYHSDNVLCLFNYLLSHKEYSQLHLIVVVFGKNRIDIYQDYINKINPNQKVSFIEERNHRNLIKYAAGSKLIFTDTGHTYFRFKTKKQQLVCLNYFVPFKNDYVNNKQIREERGQINKVFDYFLMTAPLPARVSACDKGIPLSSFLILGFCRNDVFYQKEPFNVKEYLSAVINKPISHIIVYTPTYRDYETSDKTVIRDLFGYDGTEYDELEKVLEEHEAVLLAKLHPKQINIKVSNQQSSRIVLYSELTDNQFNLYQYLSCADVLITDYTSTYFDFLHRNKPVIFNFYDFELYAETRGFGFEPIKVFCAGEIVYDEKSFISAVSDALCGEDKYKEERKKMAPIFDSYYDGSNTKRVCEYFLVSNNGNTTKYWKNR